MSCELRGRKFKLWVSHQRSQFKLWVSCVEIFLHKILAVLPIEFQQYLFDFAFPDGEFAEL